MKSKFYLKIFTVFALLILSVLLFSACQASNSDTALNNGKEECAHEWQTTSAAAPTCGEDGYLEYRCNLCKRKKTETVEALECVYETSWTWHNKNTLAVLHFECTSDASHNFSIEDKIPKSKIEPSTCISDGFEEITATVEYNGVSYTDTITLDAVGNGAHQYTIVSQTLLGESCVDGIKTVTVCEYCGDETEDITYKHTVRIYEAERYSFGEIGLCDGGFVYSMGCLCGEEKDEECFVNYSGCNMGAADEVITTKGNAVKEQKIYECTNCAFTYIAERGYSQENAAQYVGYTYDVYKLNEETIIEKFKSDPNRHALLKHEATVIYTLDEGTKDLSHRVSFTCHECMYQYESKVSHNYEKNYKLLGDSCKDGVEITSVCSDCDHVFVEVENKHVTKSTEKYEYLQDHRCCFAKTVTISECYCGERFIGGYGWDGMYGVSSTCKIERREILVEKTGFTKTIKYTYKCLGCGYLHERISVFIPDGYEAVLISDTHNVYLGEDFVFLDVIPKSEISPKETEYRW